MAYKTKDALARLRAGNEAYVAASANPADISPATREGLAANGQAPYAIVVSCSDSRVPPEHVFTAGLGELFVVRTAGNVVGAYELGSIEYGAAHLGASVIVVLGHSGCGAVAAALEGGATGAIKAITDEIGTAIGDCTDPSEAVALNIRHSVSVILADPVVADLVRKYRLIVVGAKCDLATGAVSFL